jgi:hypothetical protein
VRHLEEFTLGHRIVITFCIVLACLFALALMGFLSGSWEAHGQTRFVVPEQWRAELYALDKAGLDAAYQKQIELLYRTWVADVPTLSHDPSRISVGLSHNRQAWVLAREQLETRQSGGPGNKK